METTATVNSSAPAPTEMVREVLASNRSLRRLFARYNSVKATLKLLESHPATPQMAITLRLQRHKEWLHDHICKVLRSASGPDRIAA